ncbi:MAG: LytTR family DNA-binding domain-containing protein [Bacillota bacterium]|nr:LytTR family DNA-binding domain-containing protein [Bacillota bacterium]
MYLAICDDDLNELKELTIKCKHALVSAGITSPLTIHAYQYGHALIEHIEKNPQIQYDIIMMDNDFGENTLNGIETTKKLREMEITTPVIISTSHDDYLRQGYGYGIFRYIIKPAKQEDIDEAFTACLKYINQLEGKEMIIKNGIDTIAIRFKEIMYFECCAHTVIAHTKNKNEFSFIMKFELVEKMVPQTCFMKIHKGLIVNFNYASRMKGSDLILNDGTILPVAQRRRTQCLDFFRNYVKGYM